MWGMVHIIFCVGETKKRRSALKNELDSQIQSSQGKFRCLVENRKEEKKTHTQNPKKQIKNLETQSQGQQISIVSCF